MSNCIFLSQDFYDRKIQLDNLARLCDSSYMNTYLIETAQFALGRVWVNAARIYGRTKIGERPIIVLNNRLKTTCGRAFLEENKIDLSTTLFSKYTPAFVRDIIPHEAAHHIAYRIFQDAGHGRDWKGVMRNLGLEPRLWYPFDKPEDKA